MHSRPKGFRVSDLSRRIDLIRNGAEILTGEPAAAASVNGSETTRGKQIDALVEWIVTVRHSPGRYRTTDAIRLDGQLFGITAVIPHGPRYVKLHVRRGNS